MQGQAFQIRENHSVSFRRNQVVVGGDSGAVFYNKVTCLATLKQFPRIA
jgi:hypothetical protein